jgi:hypothetical protein
MNHMMRYGAGLTALLVLAGPAAGADDAALIAAANGFYAVYSGFHPSDGIPNDAARARYAPVISPALEKLLMEAAAAEQRFAKENKDSPPLIEGDLFSSLFEGATSYSVKSCNVTSASCAVDLTYDDKAAKPVHWTDTLHLIATPQGWRVDDISYGGNWDFANKGRLTETLRMVISDTSN